MTCSVHHIIGPTGGHTVTKGTRPAKACRWDVSVYLVLPDGSKDTHSFTIQSAQMFDLVPLVNERVEDLKRENGDLVTGAGWQAHGRGTPKPKKRKR